MENTKEKIKLFYTSNFNKNQPDDRELNIIIQQNCDCNQCGKNLFDMNDFPDFTTDGRMLCEYCYTDEVYDTCNICENYYEKHESVEDHVFYINHETSKSIDIKVGIYQVLQFPYFYGNIVTGFEGFFDNAITLIKEININEIYRFLGYEEPKNGLICLDCYFTYSGKKRVCEKYINKHTSLHQNINMRGFIQKGKVF